MKSIFMKLTTLFIFLGLFAIGQSSPNKWYFGYQSGLNFSKGDNPYVIKGETGETKQKGIQNEWMTVENELSTVMSDDKGEVLFYSDGSRIWDNHYHEAEVLLQSSNSHAQILSVKTPNKDDEYLLIHPRGSVNNVTGWDFTQITVGENERINVIQSNNALLVGNYMQAATIVPHCNGIDYWAVFHGAGLKSRQSYESVLIDSSLTFKKVVSKGTYALSVSKGKHGFLYKSIGIMNVNHKHNQLATTFFKNGTNGVCEIVNFNNKTGVVDATFAQINNFSDPDDVYGVAFSPNDSLLYITECEGEKLNQYEIYYQYESQINASRKLLHHGHQTNARFGQIQEGPNKRLYIPMDFQGRAYELGCNFIGEIEFPNRLGENAKWRPEQICIPVEYKMHLGLGLPSLPIYHIECPQEKIITISPDTIVEITEDEAAIKISTGDTIILPNFTFESNSIELTDSAKIILQEILLVLQSNPVLKLKIHGHTDDVGDFRENLALSENRALSVKNYFISKGIPPIRLESKGYGETRPLSPNNSEASRALNRRVEFIGE
jgi:outer membrane protein OmpA-like peptidoglycan-associated protein